TRRPRQGVPSAPRHPIATSPAPSTWTPTGRERPRPRSPRGGPATRPGGLPPATRTPAGPTLPPRPARSSAAAESCPGTRADSVWQLLHIRGGVDPDEVDAAHESREADGVPRRRADEH